jgi:hypothetical protein
LLLDSWIWTCVLAADEAARLLRSATRWSSSWLTVRLYLLLFVILVTNNGSLLRSHEGCCFICLILGNQDSCHFFSFPFGYFCCFAFLHLNFLN